MGALFSADEVFAIAIQMEENGAAFYRRAAALQGGDNAALFQSLVDMEEGHKKTFEAMRAGFAGSQPDTDLYNEGGLYLAAIAGGHRVEGSPKVAATLTGNESAADLLQIAIGLEKEGILFYLGMRDVVPEALGKDKIDFIIDEEKKHLVSLTAELKKVRAG